MARYRLWQIALNEARALLCDIVSPLVRLARRIKRRR